jgi:hypothetical protein
MASTKARASAAFPLIKRASRADPGATPCHDPRDVEGHAHHPPALIRVRQTADGKHEAPTMNHDPERTLAPGAGGKVAPATPGSLGLTIEGSARRGHVVNLASKDALSEIFGTPDNAQATALLGHCLNALKPGETGDDGDGVASDERHFMLSIVRDMAPRDPIERMLAVQMAATHIATIRSARWLANADNIPQVQAHYVGFNKLARTFATQAEALRKHRNGGKQTVVVQHVNVSDGGQAIVGNVQTGGGGQR